MLLSGKRRRISGCSALVAAHPDLFDFGAGHLLEFRIGAVILYPFKLEFDVFDRIACFDTFDIIGIVTGFVAVTLNFRLVFQSAVYFRTPIS